MSEGEWKPMPGYPPKFRPSYGTVIGHLLGWSELTRMHSYDYFMAPQWRARIGKVTPKREYIRYLVQRERAAQAARLQAVRKMAAKQPLV